VGQEGNPILREGGCVLIYLPQPITVGDEAVDDMGFTLEMQGRELGTQMNSLLAKHGNCAQHGQFQDELRAVTANIDHPTIEQVKEALTMMSSKDRGIFSEHLREVIYESDDILSSIRDGLDTGERYKGTLELAKSRITESGLEKAKKAAPFVRAMGRAGDMITFLSNSQTVICQLATQYAVWDSVINEDWSLPKNYDTEEADRGIVLACSFHAKSPNPEQEEIAASLSTQIQTGLVGIKRFQVCLLHQEGTYRSAEDFASQKDLAPIIGSPTRPDLFLIGEVATNVSKVMTRGGNEQYSYEITLSANLVDKNRTALWSHYFEGRRVSRTAILGLGGRILGGFDPRSEADVTKAIMESGRFLPQELAQALAHEFPITGAVTGKLGDRLSFTHGLTSGLNDGVQFLVWYRMSGGLAIPIGKAHARASAETATLEVYSWNTLDTDAKAIIDQLDARPDWMQDKAGDREGIFATSAGLPSPPR
jgi:hypothetical protein